MPTQNLSARHKAVKEDPAKVESESVADHSAMGWAESIKLV